MTTGEAITPTEAADPAAADSTQGGWRIVKDLRSFDQMWTSHPRMLLDHARVVLGHTRFPTQGRAPRLTNASPLSVGQLIGTHNGDIDATALRTRYLLPPAAGDTDTEVLLQALDAAGGTAAPTVHVLRRAVGRAALVWADRRHPHRIWLARTAISPLAVGIDEDHTLYWASNPGWLATAAQKTGIRIRPERTWLLPEGTVIAVDFSGDRARLGEHHRFTPTARVLDEELLDPIAHLGFNDEHRRADRRLIRHRTLHEVASPGEHGACHGSEDRTLFPARPAS